jgi:octaprenyl-diphosphate synthase
MNLGLAFQIQDDVLDYKGSAADLGKNAGDDFAEGKSTLPLILAMRATPAEGAFWERTIARREQKDGDFQRAQSLMKTSGALETAREVARAYADQARAALAIFEAGPWRNALENLAIYSVERQT